MRPLKIVVADDEQDTREYFQELLIRWGYEVRSAATGQQLVEACKLLAPDLIVTDYAMPGLTGLAAAQQVNQVHPTPVVLISGRHDVDQLAQASGLTITFLNKPVKERELKAAIEALTAAPASVP